MYVIAAVITWSCLMNALYKPFKVTFVHRGAELNKNGEVETHFLLFGTIAFCLVTYSHTSLKLIIFYTVEVIGVQNNKTTLTLMMNMMTSRLFSFGMIFLVL